VRVVSLATAFHLDERTDRRTDDCVVWLVFFRKRLTVLVLLDSSAPGIFRLRVASIVRVSSRSSVEVEIVMYSK
jgi:hypothetical protein